MSRAYDLFKRYTMAQLIEKDRLLREDPANKIGAKPPWIYNKKTLKKMDDISWAIYYHLGKKNEDTKENIRTSV